jgi:polyisoprenoid-binding protein YceI
LENGKSAIIEAKVGSEGGFILGCKGTLASLPNDSGGNGKVSIGTYLIENLSRSIPPDPMEGAANYSLIIDRPEGNGMKKDKEKYNWETNQAFHNITLFPFSLTNPPRSSQVLQEKDTAILDFSQASLYPSGRLKRNFTHWMGIGVLLIGLLVPRGYGEPVTFDLSPLGKMNRIDIDLATGFGSGRVKGSFSQVVGRLHFSVRQPGQTKGQILMDARSLRFGYGKVNGDAHTPEWLNSNEFPRISFKLETLGNTVWIGDSMQADANGKLTIKGTSIPISVPVNLKYLRAERRRYDGKNGDVIYLNGEFPLSRGKFGINTGSALDTVLDSLTVRIQLMAGSDRIRPFLPSRIFGGHP